MEFKYIAHINTDFSEKFGIPRQSRMVEGLQGTIVFEKEFRNIDAIRGLEDFSHIWLIWEFSENIRDKWSALVRPPRLGGDTYKGVFATRSPFRPNPIGLSCVKIEKIDIESGKSPLIYVSGVDMVDNTPIYDIKPYIPYADSVLNAKGGFCEEFVDYRLDVIFCNNTFDEIPIEKRVELEGILSNDPRPAYQNNPQRVYGLTFSNMNIKFRVQNNILYVLEITKLSEHKLY